MNRYHNHQELIKRFKLLVTKRIPNIRVFDRTTGVFFAKRVENGVISYVPVRVNTPGMADMYAIINCGRFAVHVEIEFKTGNAVQTAAQKNWQNFINNIMGAKYFLIRDEFEGVAAIEKYMNEIKNAAKIV